MNVLSFEGRVASRQRHSDEDNEALPQNFVIPAEVAVQKFAKALAIGELRPNAKSSADRIISAQGF
ncbi:MAG TPA: hypothetical protein VHU22_06160 [Xanthobacteraceae bacterium]|jgi:hypothetical protein|nr:hypothetical protein [Xanthobacteraceae bacterium]